MMTTKMPLVTMYTGTPLQPISPSAMAEPAPMTHSGRIVPRTVR